MPSSHLILCRPLLLLPPIPPSIRVFSNESTLHMRWPKYWSFSFGIILSKEHPGLISFRMDWLDLLAVQGTLRSLLQHHSSKASILLHSAFFTVQLSHPYMTTGKTIALTRRTFVGKVMSLLFNMLSRLVITLIIRLQVKQIIFHNFGGSYLISQFWIAKIEVSWRRGNFYLKAATQNACLTFQPDRPTLQFCTQDWSNFSLSLYPASLLYTFSSWNCMIQSSNLFYLSIIYLSIHPSIYPYLSPLLFLWRILIYALHY